MKSKGDIMGIMQQWSQHLFLKNLEKGNYPAVERAIIQKKVDVNDT